MKTREGIFFVVSAPSGTGKTTLCLRVLQELSNLQFTISYTTRLPRAGEVDGKHYHFVDQARFERMIAERRFAEHANVYGNWYGTSKDELESNRAAGRDLLIEIDVQGARSLKQHYPEAVLVFVHPPSLDELRRRLTGRGTDDEAVIQRRLGIAAKELAEMPMYDYLIENRDLEEAVVELKSVVLAERRRRDRVLPLIADRFPGAL